MLKAIQRSANKDEGGLCFIPKWKVYHKHFFMPLLLYKYKA